VQTIARVSNRGRQVGYGKAAPGYAAYSDFVPKASRRPGEPNHPLTPPTSPTLPCRQWCAVYRDWRRALHSWDIVAKHTGWNASFRGRGGLLSSGDVEENPGPTHRPCSIVTFKGPQAMQGPQIHTEPAHSATSPDHNQELHSVAREPSPPGDWLARILVWREAVEWHDEAPGRTHRSAFHQFTAETAVFAPESRFMRANGAGSRQGCVIAIMW